MGLLGPRLDKIAQLSLPAPERRNNRIDGAVIYVDGFGNLVTNIDRETVDRLATSFRSGKLLVKINDGAPMEILTAYADALAGSPLATFGSFELLEIAVRDGSAASFFHASEGTQLSVVISE